MPVWKYRDVSEMPPPPRPATTDELVRRIRSLWRRAARFGRGGYPPGVYKFRSLEQAQAARERVRRR